MATIKALIDGQYVDLPPYATAFYGGEYPDLNFSVVGGTEQPTVPTENMIWVNTDTAITDWIFSAIQPTSKSDGTPLSGGEVWFNVAAVASAPFNALKKNGLWVYPARCQQYVGGTWTTKEAKTYQGGVWVEWSRAIFANGAFALGFSTKAFEGTYISVENGVLLAEERVAAFNIEPSIDLSYYSTLEVDFEAYGTSNTYDTNIAIGVNKENEWSDGGFDYPAKYFYGQSTGDLFIERQTISIDISSLSGSYYFAVSSYAMGGMALKFYSIKFY